MRVRLTLVLVLVLAACGGGGPAGQQPTTTEGAEPTTTEAETTTTPADDGTTTTEAMGGDGTVVATGPFTMGMILVDGDGMTLYVLTADSDGESTCYDECAQAWPPFLAEDGVQAQGDVQADLLGTTTRDDGSTQVTYADMPLYYFIQDGSAGDVTGQGIESFGGTWWVMGPDGEPITATASGYSY